jgi:hypothetical protein
MVFVSYVLGRLLSHALACSEELPIAFNRIVGNGGSLECFDISFAVLRSDGGEFEDRIEWELRFAHGGSDGAIFCD